MYECTTCYWLPLVFLYISDFGKHLFHRPLLENRCWSRYYIRFACGRCAWEGPEDLGQRIRDTNAEVQRLAFGEGWADFVVLFADGSQAHNGLPRALASAMARRRGRPAEVTPKLLRKRRCDCEGLCSLQRIWRFYGVLR